MRFCPTGAINPDNAGTYLSLHDIECAGGSWKAPANLIEARNFEAIVAPALPAADL
jgi:2-dehydro-3-deoxyphosphogluconate aldolase/(4S)-4-hydroxy-2-oxoglutarate aldolase